MAYFNGAATTNFGGNSPTGAFSPTIFSQRVLNFFRTSSVVEGITNNDYFGELASFGDAVRIILEPHITVDSYLRGQTVTSEALPDNEITIQIDKANKFQFQIDDIEDKLAHVNWEQMASSSATYSLKNAYDREVLTFMSTGAQDSNIIGTGLNHGSAQETANVITLGHGGGAEVDPLNLLSLLALKLDEAEVPEEGRYVVISPRFMELLARTDSKLLSTDYNQGEGGLKNGLVMTGKLRGFSLYKTNNAPKFTTDTTGEATSQAVRDANVDNPTHLTDNETEGGDDVGAVLGDIIIAGHMSAVAAVSCIDKMEKIRSETTFADIVRGLHVYGRAIIRPESLAVAYVVYA
jgi:hypothetical protein